MPGGIGGGGFLYPESQQPAKKTTIKNPTQQVNGQWRAYAQPQAKPQGPVFGSPSIDSTGVMLGLTGPGAGGAGGAAAGAGGAGGGQAFNYGGGDLKLTAEKSPDIEAAKAQYQQMLSDIQKRAESVDQNLQYQVEQYKERLGPGPTQRAIERAASAIRDQMAGMTHEAQVAAARGGRTAGFGAAGLGESAQRAAAGAAADISLGREGQLDQLLLGGQNIMAAPGQRQLAYDTLGTGFFAQNPYMNAANYGLAEKDLGLRAYLGQGNLAIENARAQAQVYGSPMDWYKMMFSGLF